MPVFLVEVSLCVYSKQETQFSAELRGKIGRKARKRSVGILHTLEKDAATVRKREQKTVNGKGMQGLLYIYIHTYIQIRFD